MKKFLFSTTIALALLAGCSKPDQNGGGNGSVSPGVGSITLHWLYDIKDWIKDTDTELNYPNPVHFYANKTNIKYIFKKDGSYTFNYVAMPSNTAMYEAGSWSYDENTLKLTLIPSSGSPYSYRITALRDEHMNWGYTYTTYDNEGVPNGTAEEIVPLYGEK